jgi:NTE family protein
MKRALVLGGGGAYGIAWESGILVGLAQAGVDVRGADFIVGTSAGSQVGAVVASGLAWEAIWARQVDPLLQNGGAAPVVDMPALFRLYAQIQAEAKNPQEWLLSQGTLSRYTVTVSECERLGEIEQRLQLSTWPERLGVVGVDILSGKRVVWTRESGVDLIPAVAASSALPGVYPAITIGEHRYCDGGVYSMENADAVEGYAKVLILCVGLPIQTPYVLDQQIESLRRSGAEVEVIQPDQDVLSILHQTGGSPVNPKLRAPVAQAAKVQGQALAQGIASFWSKDRTG